MYADDGLMAGLQDRLRQDVGCANDHTDDVEGCVGNIERSEPEYWEEELQMILQGVRLPCCHVKQNVNPVLAHMSVCSVVCIDSALEDSA